MSELKKLQAKDDDWRSSLKDFLLCERKISTKSITSEDSQKYNLDLSEEFQKILEEKKLLKQKQNTGKDTKMENKENKIYSVNKFTPSQKCCNDSTIFHQGSFSPFVQRNVDDSFEEIEKMCNKSASDPDSTLFKYLNKNKTKNKIEIHYPTSDEEADALQRLLDELKEEKEEEKEKNKNKVQDETQLNEIEAPSCFWENTMFGDTIHPVTPVKSTEMKRPSTIVEELLDTSESSSLSFKSALKCNENNDFYETASPSPSSNRNSHNFCNSRNHQNDEKPLIKSFNLIDLNESCISCLSSSASDEESIIEILSDNEEKKIKIEKSSVFDSKIENEPNLDNDSFNEIQELSKNQEENFDFENESNDTSLHFNDTIEQVEYMMKKGIEYLEADKNFTLADIPTLKKEIKPKQSPANICLEEKKIIHFENSNKISKIIDDNLYHSPAMKEYNQSTTSSKMNIMKSPKCISEMNSIKKLEIFKKPLRTENTNHLLPVSKKHPFSHIISPIGAYIKNTAKSPFISEIKSPKTDVTNSSTFRKLDYESRSIHPFSNIKKDTKLNTCKSPGGSTCRLPKKAYISSEFKHVVDKRTPMKIPGGEKIQRYIQPTLLPAVVQHNGKIKSPAGIKSKINNTKTQIPRDSLADLSLMSGDVSLYTIKDAQRF